MPSFYETSHGRAYNSEANTFLTSEAGRALAGQVNLILTSPPYPLAAPKAYGNKNGKEYTSELLEIFSAAIPLLAPDGSMVVEIGNAWEKGVPEMQTLPVETLLQIKSELNLALCQMFVWENPNKLPGPATWVNVKRVRVKDSFTHIWWYATTPNPKANNRNVLTPYKGGMERLLGSKKYNRGTRPSGHSVGEGFLVRNQGAIPSSVLSYTNSVEAKEYVDWCVQNDLPRHPARMPQKLAEFFINLTTEPGDLVFDPFGGSNTTGRVAQNLDRNWIVTEMSENYWHGSKGRFLDSINISEDTI